MGINYNPVKFTENLKSGRKNELWVFLYDDKVTLAVDHIDNEAIPEGETIRLTKEQVDTLIQALTLWAYNVDNK